jgi:hypothetical protein
LHGSGMRKLLLMKRAVVPSPLRVEDALSARWEKVPEGRMRGPSLRQNRKSPLTSSAE